MRDNLLKLYDATGLVCLQETGPSFGTQSPPRINCFPAVDPPRRPSADPAPMEQPSRELVLRQHLELVRLYLQSSLPLYIYISDRTLRLSQGSLFCRGRARPPPPCLLGVPPNSRCVGACSEMAQCKKRCGRRANVPRFGTCCGACPTRHTRECGVRHPAACTHQCGRKANRPRFISCCGSCPDRHTRQCGFRQGLPGVVLETSTGTLAVESRGRFSATEPEDDIALCWMCRCEIPTDEVFWCLNRGCEYACNGVCFDCLTGHVCRVAPVEISPLAAG